MLRCWGQHSCKISTFSKYVLNLKFSVHEIDFRCTGIRSTHPPWLGSAIIPHGWGVLLSPIVGELLSETLHNRNKKEGMFFLILFQFIKYPCFPCIFFFFHFSSCIVLFFPYIYHKLVKIFCLFVFANISRFAFPCMPNARDNSHA